MAVVCWEIKIASGTSPTLFCILLFTKARWSESSETAARISTHFYVIPLEKKGQESFFWNSYSARASALRQPLRYCSHILSFTPSLRDAQTDTWHLLVRLFKSFVTVSTPALNMARNNVIQAKMQYATFTLRAHSHALARRSHPVNVEPHRTIRNILHTKLFTHKSAPRCNTFQFNPPGCVWIRLARGWMLPGTACFVASG